MAFKTKLDLSADKTIMLGGVDKTTNKPNPKSVEGYYIGSRSTPDKGYGEGTLHFFQTPEGTIGVWGKTRLNNLLTKDLAGQMCRVTFTGRSPKTKGRNPAYMFTVEHDEENTVDVSGISLAPEDSISESEDDAEAGESEEGYDEGDVGDEEPPVDEVPPKRATPPARPAVATDAARKAKVQALLNRSKVA